MAKKKLFLIDGAALFYRAYYAFIRNPLINSKGENTSAPYGFVNAVVRLLSEEKPDYLAVVFDTPKPTFRHHLYADYKANREKMPDEMRQQIPRIHEFLQLMKIPGIELVGYEADDIIATIADKESHDDIHVLMMTGDKDFMQLIKPGVSMYAQGKGGAESEITNKKGVINKFGVEPDKVIEVLGLMGDSSDNIPGVPKVGPKTAQNLIVEYGSIENLYQHIDQLKQSKVKENLIEFKDLAFLSRKLVTIDQNVPVEYNLDEFIIDEIDPLEVEPWFKEMEFNSLWQRLSTLNVIQTSPGQSDIDTGSINYILVNDRETLKLMITELQSYRVIAFDTETTGLSIQDDKLVGASFAGESDKAWYVNLDANRLDMDLRSHMLSAIKIILEDNTIRKVAQNGKFDIQVLRQVNIEVKPLYFDTMLAAYLLDSNDEHNMDHLAQRYLNYKTISFSELTGGKSSDLDISTVDMAKLTQYAAEDADITFQLYGSLQPKIEEENLRELLYDLEIPVSLVLADMELNGVKLDTSLLMDFSKDLEKQLEALIKSLYEEAGKEFNLNSPTQLGPILYEELEVHKSGGIKRIPRTKTGKYSTAENILQKFEDHPFVAKILQFRKLNKLKSTYVDALPPLISQSSGLLHTSYNQTVAATGRLSSSDPNLQNIPIRSDEGRKIRAAFVPRDKGRKILSADYSQVELRIMASLSGDENMIKAFEEGEDIHRSTAAKVFNVAIDMVDEDKRRKAKEVNFGIIYGMSQWGLARRLDISNSEAEEFISSYFSIYPKVQKFMIDTIAQATDKGFVETVLKRKRFIPELQSTNRQTFENGQRMAINTRIQGSAADLIKKAMIEINDAVKSENLDALMIMQVHDELVFDVAEGDVEKLSALVTEKMENALKLSVPLKVEVGVGNNWLEAH